MGLSALSGSAVVRSYLCSFLRIGIVVTSLCLCVSAFCEDTPESRFDEIIASAAEEHGVDPLLIKAMIWHESRFKPLAEGKSGEIGLMQIKMVVVQDWAKAKGKELPLRDEVFDPYLNIEIGTWYFGRAFKKWSECSYVLPLALGEYNAGPRRLKEWIEKAGGDRFAALEQSASANYIRSIRTKYMEYILGESMALASVNRSVMHIQ